MSLTVVSRPQRIINALTTPEQISKWNAVWHPTIFKLQRQDYSIADLYANPGTGGGMVVLIDGDITDELTIGDFIYLFTNDAGYDDQYEILDFYLTGASPDQTAIVIDAGIITAASIGASSYVNILSRLAYFVEIRVLEYTTGVPVETTTEYAQFRPNASGLIKADLQEWLQPLIQAIDQYDYLQTSIKDANLGQPFNIQYREHWKTEGYSDWSVLTTDNLHYIANAVKQSGDEFGQNIGEFVMFPPDTASPPVEGSRGKFLTKFPVPVYFEGYPFSLAFVYSDEYDADGRQLVKIEDTVDGNNQEIAIHSDVLIDYSGFINRLKLRGSYPSNAKAVYVTLRTEGRSAYVVDGYVDIDYVDETTGIAISESIYVRIGDSCTNNPEYLAWLNPAGGFDYWLFAVAQDVTDRIDNEETFERYAEDLADQQARERTQSKEAQEEIIIGASQLTKGQAEGLRHMLASPLVLRFRGYDSTTLLPKWQRVGIKKSTFLIYKTDEQKSELTCTILPPQKYVQQQ